MNIRAVFLTLAIVVSSLIPVAGTASAATTETSCYWNFVRQSYTREWVETPLPLGTKVCYVPTGTTWEWADNVDRYVHPPTPGAPSTYAPTFGGARYTWARTVADRTRAMARDEGVTLQFAAVDAAGRGCFWNDTSSAAYVPDGQGTGIVRMGNSLRPDCNDDLDVTLSTAAHELAHAWIEKTCGTTRPPMATGRDRMEDVTSTLGYMHFADEVARWGGEIRRGTYTGNDVWRAKQLLSGRCE